MTPEYPPYIIVHADHGDPDCPGLLFAVPRDGGVADFKCNNCGAVVRTVSFAEVQATIEAMRDGKGERVTKVCPYCGELNDLPGYSEMFAFVCRHCGKSEALRYPSLHSGD